MAQVEIKCYWFSVLYLLILQRVSKDVNRPWDFESIILAEKYMSHLF
jgi:hypothetical protein